MKDEKELKIGSEDDMLAHASKFGFSGIKKDKDSDSILELSIILFLLSGKDESKAKKTVPNIKKELERLKSLLKED